MRPQVYISEPGSVPSTVPQERTCIHSCVGVSYLKFRKRVCRCRDRSCGAGCCPVRPPPGPNSRDRSRRAPTGPAAEVGPWREQPRSHIRPDPSCNSPETRVSGGALKDGNEQGDDKGVWVRASGLKSMGALPRRTGTGQMFCS